jgi:hypothetical protein
MPITKVKERCLGCFLRVQRAVSHASWPCKQRPIPHRLAEIPARPSATRTELVTHSFASPHVGPLTRADGPPTGRAGRMSGPAGLPSGNHALSGPRTVLSATIRAALQLHGEGGRNYAELAGARAVVTWR